MKKMIKKSKVSRFEKYKNSKFLSDRLTVWLCILLAFFTLTAVPVFAAGGSGSGSDDGKTVGDLTQVDKTLTHFSELVAEGFGTVIHNSNGHLSDVYTTIDTHASIYNIGNLFGMAPGETMQQNNENAGGNINTGGSAPSAIYGFGQFTEPYAISNKSQNILDTSYIQYIAFGCALKDGGIDEVRTATNSGADVTRAFFGYVIYILYFLAYSAGNVVNTALDLLKAINIFSLIYGNPPTGTGPLAQIYNTTFIQKIRGVYEWMKGFRYVIIGIMIVFLISSLTVFKTLQMNKNQVNVTRIRTFIYRVIVMFIGIPLAGMIYTEALDILGDYTNAINYNVHDYIYGQFMDFETWSTENYFSGCDLKAHVDLANNEVIMVTDPWEYAYNTNSVAWALHSRMANGPTSSVNSFIIPSFDSRQHGLSSIFNTHGNTTVLTGQFSDLTEEVNDTTGAVIHNAMNQQAFDFNRELIIRYARGDVITPTESFQGQYEATLNSIAVKVNKILGSADADVRATVISAYYKTLLSEDSITKIWGNFTNGQFSAINQRNAADLLVANQIDVSNVDGTTHTLVFAGMPGLYDVYDQGSGGSSSVTSGSVICIDGFTTGSVGHGAPSYVTSSTLNAGNVVFGEMLGGHVNTYSVSSSTTPRRIGSANMTVSVSNPHVTVDPNNSGYLTCEADYEYNMVGGMSTLACFNYLSSNFENGTVSVVNPTKVTNENVANKHYSVTTPYSGLNELIQLAFTAVMLFAVGIIGWVFGISMLMNCFVEMVKIIPAMFKMMVGSLTGFVEALATGLAIVVEILVTILLYSLTMDVMNFVIVFVKTVINEVVKFITNAGSKQGVYTGTYNDVGNIIANIACIALILWAVFQLIKWRSAVITSVKSIITHTLNQVFGTQAKMPTGANGGMLGLAAGAAAAGVGLHALAGEGGGLSDVVNDLTGGNAGDALSEQLGNIRDDIANGDLAAAVEDGQDLMRGGWMQGGTGEGESESDADDGNVGKGINKYNDAGLTDDQQSKVDEIAQSSPSEAEKMAATFKELNERDEKAAIESKGAGYRGDANSKFDANGLTAQDNEDLSHIPDSAAREAEETERIAANFPMTEDQQKEYNDLMHRGDSEGAAAYRAKAVRANAAQAHSESAMMAGLTSEQQADVQSYLAAGDASGAQAAADSYLASNASQDYMYGNQIEGTNINGLTTEQQAVVDAIPDTKAAASQAATFRRENAVQAAYVQGGAPQATYQASNFASGSVSSGALQQLATQYDASGLTQQQAQVVNSMVAGGANETQIAAAVNEYQQANFGDNASATVRMINNAAGRESTVVYGSNDNSGGNARTITISGQAGSNGGVQYQVVDSNKGSAQTVITREVNGASAYRNISTNEVFSVQDANGGSNYGTMYVNNNAGAQQAMQGGNFVGFNEGYAAAPNSGSQMVNRSAMGDQGGSGFYETMQKAAVTGMVVKTVLGGVAQDEEDPYAGR